MSVVTFSQRDLLRGTVVTPGWYRCRIDSIGEQAVVTEKGPSINYPTEATILFNGDNGDTQFANVPLSWVFNSKAIGFAAGFLKAFGVEIKPGDRYNLSSAEGKELDIFVENGTYQGRINNKVNHQYRAPRAEVTPVTSSAQGV